MNSSQNGTEWRKIAYITALPPLLSLSVMAMISNCFVIIRFCRLRRQFTVNMKLTFSLAVADLWVSSLLLSALVGNSLLPQIVSRRHVDMACFILTLEGFKLGAIITSILHLLILSANQCFSIINPFAHKILITSSVCKLTLVFIWLMPACSFFIYFYCVPNQGYRSPSCTNLWPYHMRPFRTIVFLLIALPMVLMIKAYAVIWIYLNKSTSFPGCIALNSFRRRNSTYKRQIQTIITTVLIVGTFVLSWFPSILLYLLVCQDCIFRINDMNPQLLFALSSTKMALILVKLSLNPFIYSPGINSRTLLRRRNVRRMNNDVVSILETFRREGLRECKDSLQMMQIKEIGGEHLHVSLGSSGHISFIREKNKQIAKEQIYGSVSTSVYV